MRLAFIKDCKVVLQSLKITFEDINCQAGVETCVLKPGVHILHQLDSRFLGPRVAISKEIEEP